MFGCPHIDLFATRANNKFSIYVSPVPDPMAQKQAAFQQPLDNLSVLCVPSIHFASPGFVKGSGFSEPLHDPHHSIMAAEGVVLRLSGSSSIEESLSSSSCEIC